jgi:outer membrane protein assembly factor BamB
MHSIAQSLKRQASSRAMKRVATLLTVGCLCVLAGCSSMNPFSGKKPRNEPAPLQQFKPSMATRTLWTAEIGKSGDYFLAPAIHGGKVYAASAAGELASFDASNGKQLWRTQAGIGITAGVATDGTTLAVAGTDGALMAFDASTGKLRWKMQAPTEILSSPAIGNGMIVVRSMDNLIAAYDVETGARRWFVQRSAPPLVLRAAPGIVIADGLAFVALPAGRLLALSVTTGVARWEAAIAEPRGATELERVADVSGMPVMLARDICAVAYQGRIACVDAGNGSMRWARELSAEVGPGIDQRYVFGADEKGHVSAFSRDAGINLWRNTSLGYRRLTTPVSFGRAVVVGDREGYLHFLSREEGAMLARVPAGSSAIRATPVVAGASLIVQNIDGKLFAISTD